MNQLIKQHLPIPKQLALRIQKTFRQSALGILIKEFFAYFPFLKQLIRRDFKRKYYKSALGVLWTILNPLFVMIIVTVVFSTLFKRSIPNFPVYYLCGWLMFHFNSEATAQSLCAIVNNAGLINKIRVPKYFFPLAQTILSAVNTTLSLIPLLIIVIATKAPLSWTMLLIPIPMFFVFLFAVGLSLALSALTVYFRDISHLYSVFTMAWTYLTPIFYPVAIIPESIHFLWDINPMFHYCNMMRDLVLYGALPGVTTTLCAAGFSLFSLLAGCLIFSKLQDAFFLHI